MRTINVMRIACLAFTLANVTPVFAASCYRTNSVKGEIEGLDGDASLTYVTLGRPEFQDELILDSSQPLLRNKKSPDTQLITDMGCSSKPVVCRIGNGSPLQFVYSGDELKIETKGPITLKADEANELYLTVSKGNNYRVVSGMTMLSSDECNQLVSQHPPPFIKVGPDEQPPVLDDKPDSVVVPGGDALPDVKGLR